MYTYSSGLPPNLLTYTGITVYVRDGLKWMARGSPHLIDFLESSRAKHHSSSTVTTTSTTSLGLGGVGDSSGCRIDFFWLTLSIFVLLLCDQISSLYPRAGICRP